MVKTSCCVVSIGQAATVDNILSCYSPVARSACDALTGVLISGLSGVTWRESASSVGSTLSAFWKKHAKVMMASFSTWALPPSQVVDNGWKHTKIAELVGCEKKVFTLVLGINDVGCLLYFCYWLSDVFQYLKMLSSCRMWVCLLILEAICLQLHHSSAELQATAVWFRVHKLGDLDALESLSPG